MTDSPPKNRILCVDDDPTMLQALRLTLGRFFEVETATSGQEGLTALNSKGPFAVILSDMIMPGMDGSAFLNEANHLAPDAVRVMLTGNSDQKTAMRAVNEGHVFQLVNKPCDLTALVKTMHTAVKQHQLLAGERELLEQTLNGSVKLLTDILAMADPTSFGKAQLLRDYVLNYLTETQESSVSRWEIEMAAMLSHLGLFTIPRSILEKIEQSGEVSDAEQEILDRIPETGFDLLVNIPRLRGVANIVRYQNKNYDGSGFPKDNLSGEEIPYGARMMRVLKDLMGKEASGLSRDKSVAFLQARAEIYDPKILAQCAARLKFRPNTQQMADQISTILIAELNNKHVLVSPLITTEGILIAPSGTEMSNLLLERIRNFRTLHEVVEPIQVKLRNPVNS